MKKIVLCLSSLLVGGIMNVNAQCSVKLNTQKSKFCSNETTSISATPSDIKTLPNFSDSKQVFDVSTIQGIQGFVPIIKQGNMMGFKYPLAETSGTFNLALNGYQLKNTAISSGSIDVSIVTDLKQDLTLIFELPYFIKNGKSIKDSIKVDGTKAGTGIQTFTKTFDLSNTLVDFSAGNSSNYNLVKYIITPSIKISTKTFSGTETGDLKIDLNNIVLAENISYSWFKDGVLLSGKNTPTIDVNENGKYLVSTTSNCGTSKDSIEIQVIEMPSKSVTTTGNLTFCEGDSVKLSADGTGSYKWSNNNITKDTYISKSGSYTVTITNDICSIISDPIQVTVNPNPEVKLNHKDTTIIIGNELNVKATGGTSYEWNDKSTNDNITIKEAGTYTVTGKNVAGCTSTASIKVEVREKGAGLTNLNNVKVAVSPNPSSDVLHITVDEFKNKAVSIVDLKGNLIFNQTLNSANTTIAVDSFAKGMYVLNILDESNSVVNSQRIVVE